MAQKKEMFLREAKGARPYQEYIQWMLEEEGFCARVPEERYAPLPELIDRYSDDGDVLVSLPSFDSEQMLYRVEVKSRWQRFTSIKDFPSFGGDRRVIVERVATWQHKRKLGHMPFIYIMISKYTYKHFCISTRTKGRWDIRMTEDKERAWIQPYYVADRTLFHDWPWFLSNLKKLKDSLTS